MRSAGLTHFRRSGSRVRVLLLYVRRATAVKLQPWAEKVLPRKLIARRMTFAPAAATFALPRRRSHFPRIPFGDAHEDFGLPQ